MLGGRAIGAIIGIISACCLFLLLVACGLVFYRRHLARKASSYSAAATQEDECPNENIVRRSGGTSRSGAVPKESDSPPPYAEAIKQSQEL